MGLFHRCSEDRDRTCDLRVMSPTSYRCSTSRCGCKCRTNNNNKQRKLHLFLKDILLVIIALHLQNV